MSSDESKISTVHLHSRSSYDVSDKIGSIHLVVMPERNARFSIVGLIEAMVHNAIDTHCALEFDRNALVNTFIYVRPPNET